MKEDALTSLSDRVGSEISRRKALRTMAVAAAGFAAVVLNSQTASADTGGRGRNIQANPAIANLKPDSCGIYCYPVDCCCCDPPNYPNLVKCVNSCDGTYMYHCASLCSFCASQAC